MKRFGLTGGIATGKSTVSQMLRDLGWTVVDADLIAREVVEPGQPALAEILARFPTVAAPDGRLNRSELAKRVFSDPAERAALNAIIHPSIRQSAETKMDALARAGVRRVIYDAALLIENGLQAEMDAVILVVAPPDVQRRRLMARDGLTSSEADARIAAQMPLEAKRAWATWVIDNGGPVEETRRQVEAVSAAMESMG